MKLEINPISGYYEGPDGVFYDFKHDEIFELEWDGAEVFRVNENNIVGRYYKHIQSLTDVHLKKHTTIVVGMGGVIRLGDL